MMMSESWNSLDGALAHKESAECSPIYGSDDLLTTLDACQSKSESLLTTFGFPSSNELISELQATLMADPESLACLSGETVDCATERDEEVSLKVSSSKEKDKEIVDALISDKALNKAIDDLDDDDFEVRNKAEKSLRERGLEALPAIAARLEPLMNQPGPTKSYAEQIFRLQRVSRQIAETHLPHANMKFLEQVLNSESKPLLKLIAKHMPEALREPNEFIEDSFVILADREKLLTAADWRALAQTARELSKPDLSEWLFKAAKLPGVP
ncbi:MAG: hypothetical protein K2Z81_09980, partial [Cyanobacteria bacterium]|nr:hypothetical protein [Cyanobacteriota bacterium]